MPTRTTSPIDKAGFARAGFVVPYEMQTWRSFVEGGDLGRTLVRMCILAQRAVPLSFVLDRNPASGITVAFVLRRKSFEVACGPDLFDEQATDGLALILRGLNAALAAHGIDRRFVVDENDHRLMLLDSRAAAWAAQRSWLADKCLEPVTTAEAKQPRKATVLREEPD